MQKLLMVIIAGSLVACHSSHKATGTAAANTLTAAEKKAGWQLLFDGSTKNGWHVYNNTSDGAAWKTADGILYLDPAEKGANNAHGGDLVTNEVYGNFHLKLEWKIDTAGNSGIMFGVQEDPKYRYSYLTGPEMQIIDNNGHPDAKFNKHRAGDLYDLVASKPENAHPWGEWNEAEIVLQNNTLELYQNGEKVVTTTLWDENWKKLIAGSKFKSLADFGAFRTGKLTLQDHGNKVWFRNIKIKKL